MNRVTCLENDERRVRALRQVCATLELYLEYLAARAREMHERATWPDRDAAACRSEV